MMPILFPPVYIKHVTQFLTLDVQYTFSKQMNEGQSCGLAVITPI